MTRFRRGVERTGENIDAVFQRGERRHVRPAAGDVIDLGGQRPHVFGDFGQRLIGSDARNHAAQDVHSRFQLLQRRWIVLRADGIDFAGNRLERTVEARQAFSRHQSAQGLAYLCQSVLDPGQRR